MYNLSSQTLTPADILLLQKGPSFFPSVGPNTFGLFKDLYRFIRSLTLKCHYAPNPLTHFLNHIGNNIPPMPIADPPSPTAPDEEALQILEQLWLEGNAEGYVPMSQLEPPVSSL